MAGEAERPAIKTNEILGIDLGTTSIKLARLKKSAQNSYTLLEADVLPPMSVDTEGNMGALQLEKKMQTTYAAVCYSGRNAAIRFLDIPAKIAESRMLETRLRKQLALGSELRVGYSIAKEGPADGDHQVLVVASPEAEITALRQLIREDRPSIASLEISGLAALHSFEQTATAGANPISCYIEAGAEVTMVSFFVEGRLALARKFEYGTHRILARLQELLDIDEDNAADILYGNPTEVARAGEDPMATFIKQLVTSRQFVEKSENVSVPICFASGGLSYSPYFIRQIQENLGIPAVIWNPLTENGIKNYPVGLKGVESMFAGALGAAMAVWRAGA